MQEQTLLQRTQYPQEVKNTDFSLQKLADSILLNLRRILNTRRGSAPAQPELGVPDLGNVIYSMPESLNEFQNSIKQTIENYEPRLNFVRVKRYAEEGDLELRFEITAQLVLERENAMLKFQTIIDSSGKIDIRD